MPDRRSVAELVCRGLLLAWLCWLPLPFGSVTERAQMPLVIGALVICAMAALARSWGPLGSLEMPQPFRLWIAGGVLFAIVVAVQLVPLPNALLGAISPESLRIWSDADRVASLAGLGAPAAAHPISVDPELTAVHLFRVVSYLAAFLAAALLMRRHRHRSALAFVLGATAVFEAAYGIREAALQRYSIWGWANKVIFNRVTGTFVNPNHFAHYAAIVMPLGVYLAAQAWHEAGPSGVPWRRRVVRLFEKHLIRFGCGVVIAFACLIAILVAQSRGALIAAVAGFAITGAAAGGRRHAVRRGVLVGVAGAALVIVIVLLLGLKISRFQEPETATLGGRGVTVGAAFALWKRFPLFGTGLGTFAEVSSMTGIGTAAILINHAHDDYAEIAATTGIAGLLVALVPLFIGYAALLRATFGRGGEELTWTRRAYQAAALTSITIALVHALIDFNFFIPANPATLAAIAGAAVPLRERR
jgi:O-antigen ligase